MSPNMWQIGSDGSLVTIPEETKPSEDDAEDIFEPVPTTNDSKPYARSNSVFINAIRRTSCAILTLAQSSTASKDLNDERKYSMPAIEARRKNRRNGE